MPNYVTRYRLTPDGLDIKDDGHILIENGATVEFEANAVIEIAGVDLSAALADAVEDPVAGVGASYKLARVMHTTVAAEDTVNMGLATVVAAVAVLEDAPTVDPLWVQACVGDQAGAPAAGRVIVKSWKPTANDNVTPVAATTFGKKVSVIAIGT
jgi:hypothetical protein